MSRQRLVYFLDDYLKHKGEDDYDDYLKALAEICHEGRDDDLIIMAPNTDLDAFPRYFPRPILASDLKVESGPDGITYHFVRNGGSDEDCMTVLQKFWEGECSYHHYRIMEIPEGRPGQLMIQRFDSKCWDWVDFEILDNS